jgi:peptidoglycan/LPS O-acetylase OafA/YrhL
MAQDPTTRPRDDSAGGAPLPSVAPGDATQPGPGSLLDPGREAPTRHETVRDRLRLPSAATAELTPHAAFLARRRFAALDGLRALAILAVVWHHTLGGPGRFGANLFFLLSGFLVTTILVRERARTGAIDVLGFRVRRARRLYPLYFTVLAVYTGLVLVAEPLGPARDGFLAHLPAFATFTSNLFVDLAGERTIFYFAWSLAAQEQFYLFWPWLLERARPRALAGGLLGLLAAVYAARAGRLDLVLPPGTFARALVSSVMPALALGALLALTLNARRGFHALHRCLGSRWCACALLAAALFLWRTPGVPEPYMHAVLTLLTAACLLREDHWLARFLRLPAVVHVGTVSYGVYLLHMLCHNAVERALVRLGMAAGWLDFALTMLLAIGAATLSHRWFESRFLPAKRAGAALRAS